MQISAKQINPEPKFNPVELTLTFDTQEALDAFWAIFNTYNVSSYFNQATKSNNTSGGYSGKIRKSIEQYVAKYSTI